MRPLFFAAILLAGCGDTIGLPPIDESTESETGAEDALSVEDSASAPIEDTALEDVAPPNDAAPPAKDAAPSCYQETWFPSAKLDALRAAYSSSKWKESVLAALKARYPDGFALVDAMKNDPDISGFATPDSWSSLMESIDTICHEEGHGWDFDNALKTPGKHTYWMRKDLVLPIPKDLGYFARNELESYITDDATSLYDDTYLTGEQGSYDFVFLAEELTQYINGLACVTTVGTEVDTYGTSFRDGAAAHLLYLEWYLNRARTSHAGLYAKMKASPEVQKLVRYVWARAHFWTAQSKHFKTFGIKDEAI
ncbi:MAG: hypothetical protein ACXWUG_04910, partial [Polyangiales bacterium]